MTATTRPWHDQPLDERGLRDLADLDQVAVPSHRHRRWLVGVAAAALATAAVVAAGVLSPATQVAVAATPPLLRYDSVDTVGAAPDAVLGELADAAAASRGPSAAQPGDVSWQEWSLTTRIDGEQVRSAVVPTEVTVDVDPDGSTSVRAVTGEPYFPTSKHEAAWREAGEPGAPGTTVRSDEYARGEYSPMYPTAPPADAAAMREYLAVGHPIDELGTAELFVAVEDLARSRTLDGQQRAAVLQVLADAEGVEVLGTTTDRLGRPGTAFSVDSDMSGLPMRYVLVFDEATGELLASETQLTTDAGRLGVPAPSVVSYSVWER